jgi:hypothetical protein
MPSRTRQQTNIVKDCAAPISTIVPLHSRTLHLSSRDRSTRSTSAPAGSVASEVMANDSDATSPSSVWLMRSACWSGAAVAPTVARSAASRPRTQASTTTARRRAAPASGETPPPSKSRSLQAAYAARCSSGAFDTAVTARTPGRAIRADPRKCCPSGLTSWRYPVGAHQGVHGDPFVRALTAASAWPAARPAGQNELVGRLTSRAAKPITAVGRLTVNPALWRPAWLA